MYSNDLLSDFIQTMKANEVSIIKLNSIGPVAVVGAHLNNTQHHFVVLPWRRQRAGADIYGNN